MSDDPLTPSAIRAVVEGRVQGVGFRYFVQEHAQRLELTGWVRNHMRGAVEVYAEGSRQTLLLFISYLERGPGMANVTRVLVEWLPPEGKHTQFSIAPTEW